MHDAAPGAAAKVPGAHDEQAILLSSDVCPTEQLVHIEPPASGAIDPAAQELHSRLPFIDEYFPGIHAKHNVPFAREPAVHMVHLPGTSQIEPAGQGAQA